MEKKIIKLPRSAKKYIRKEKSRIRKLLVEEKEKQKMIASLYKKFGVNLSA